MPKRLLVVLSILTIISIGLPGCNPAEAEIPEATQLPAIVASAEPSVLPYECTDPIGCVTITSSEPIHIAYLLVVAGPQAALGIDARNGIEIAIGDSSGQILGHPVKFDGEDGGCSADVSQTAGAKLAADPTIVAVIGPSCGSEARVALPLLSNAGFVVLSPLNTAPDLTETGNPNNHPGYLRTAYNDKVQGTVAAEFAYENLNVRKAATIHDDSLYADKLQKAFANKFQELGGIITAQETVDPKQADMSPVLTSIATGQPELIYLPLFQPAGGFIIRQAKRTSGLENIKLMGANSLFSPNVVMAAGDDIEGFMVSNPCVSGEAYDAFVAKYVAKFNEQPNSTFHAHAYAYDAFMMIKAAIEKIAVQDADGTLYIPRQALRDAMYATAGFQGLTGILSCTPTGDCANPVIGVYEYHKGAYPPELIWMK